MCNRCKHSLANCINIVTFICSFFFVHFNESKINVRCFNLACNSLMASPWIYKCLALISCELPMFYFIYFFLFIPRSLFLLISSMATNTKWVVGNTILNKKKHILALDSKVPTDWLTGVCIGSKCSGSCSFFSFFCCAVWFLYVVDK